MTQAWLTLIIGLLVLIWGALVILRPQFLNWASKESSAKIRAITDVILGALLIYIAIVFM